MGIQYSLVINLVWGTVFTIVDIVWGAVNIVWGTASTGGYGGTVFPGGARYSLVNNVCEVRYSLGYRIHSDTRNP